MAGAGFRKIQLLQIRHRCNMQLNFDCRHDCVTFSIGKPVIRKIQLFIIQLSIKSVLLVIKKHFYA